MATFGLYWQSPLNRWAGFGVAIALGVLVQIQATLPFGIIGLRINAADPVVGVVAAAALTLLVFGKWRPKWHVPYLPLWLVALTGVILLSFTVAFFTSGNPGSWAIVNRGVGWFVLIAFFLAGAVIGRAPKNVRLAFTISLCTAMALTVSVETLLFIVHSHISKLEIFAERFQFVGLLANPNSYGFFLLACFSVVLSNNLICSMEKPYCIWVRRVLLTMLLLGVVWSGSRSTYIGLAVILLVLMVLPSPPWKDLIISFAIAVPLYFIANYGPELLTVLGFVGLEGYGGPDASEQVMARVLGLGADSSSHERLALSMDALALWMNNPILGTGLGGFLRDQVAQGNEPARIHNTALWLLAETGVVGFLVFAAAFTGVFTVMWRRTNARAGELLPSAKAAVLLLSVFAVVSLFHDMLYQRILWLLLGFLLVQPNAPSGFAGARTSTE